MHRHIFKHGTARAVHQHLRLDRAESAYAATEDGVTPIKPGDHAASEIWNRITSTDPDDQMPPPSSHRTLTDAQKDLVRRWIEQGAPYAEHWAFTPPRAVAGVPREGSAAICLAKLTNPSVVLPMAETTTTTVFPAITVFLTR